MLPRTGVKLFHPIAHQPKENWEESEALKTQVNPTQVSEQLNVPAFVLWSGSSFSLLLVLRGMFPPDGGVVALRRVEELSLGDPARQLLPVHHLLHLQLFQQSAVL